MKKEKQPPSSCNHKPELQYIDAYKRQPNLDHKGRQMVWCPICRGWGHMEHGKAIFNESR